MALQVVSRSGWGARYGRRGSTSIPQVDLYVAHHAFVPDVPWPDGRSLDEQLAAERRAVRGIEHYHAVDLGWSAAPGYPWCVDTETEILTASGWKTHEQLAIGDFALTLNTDTLLSEWQPVTNVHRFVGEHRMLSMESTRHSSLTTADHRWFVRHRSAGGTKGHRGNTADVPGWQWRTSTSLTHDCGIPRAAPCATLPEQPKYTDEFVELVAWFWTEGAWSSRGGRMAVVYQSDLGRGYVERIRRCLTRLYGPAVDTVRGVPRACWREYTRRAASHEFYLSHEIARDLRAVAPDKVVSPYFIRALTAAQLELFVQTSIDADGFRSATTTAVDQRRRDRLDSLQMAVTLAGQPTRLRHIERHDMWQLTIQQYMFTTPDKPADKQWSTHRGVVWCPTTPNSTWFARRDGHVYVTGNCIGESGRVYEGVGWWRRGVHTQGQNSTSVAGCFLINGDVRFPSDAAWQAAHELVGWGIAIGAITRDYQLDPHHKYASWKSCPGTRTRPRIELIRTGPPRDPQPEEDVMKEGDAGAVPAVQLANSWLWAYRNAGNATAWEPLPPDDTASEQLIGRISWICKNSRESARITDGKVRPQHLALVATETARLRDDVWRAALSDRSDRADARAARADQAVASLTERVAVLEAGCDDGGG